jgi:UDP-N-acetylglucosamine--N-acetylmuramyl-(pentapeptide) pyrophosphoryl-undecaprenol N-acetylglucosamine transferase
MERYKKVIIAAGGTGGHLYPGVSLARELKSRGCEVLLVVRKDDPGKNILKNEGILYKEIPACGFPSFSPLRVMRFVFTLIHGMISSNSAINEFKPDAVIGMGAYVSFPVVFAAWTKRIKTIIHEQNCISGKANRILGRIVDKIAVSFEQTKKEFPQDKVVYTGNPVRPDIAVEYSQGVYEKYGLSKDKFTVLVFGGSQGASKINNVVISALADLMDIKERIQFIHLTGKKDYMSVGNGYRERGFSAYVNEYLDSMGEAYMLSDLVISRAGASTVSELEIVNKPAVLVPYPYATRNHQEYNASDLVKSHRAVLVKDKDFTEKVFAEAVKFQIKSFKDHKNTSNPPGSFPQQKLAEIILT